VLRLPGSEGSASETMNGSDSAPVIISVLNGEEPLSEASLSERIHQQHGLR